MKLFNKIFQRLSLAIQVFRYGELSKDSAGNLRLLTAEELAEIKTFFPMPKYFVFGHARSGTTLLARLLRVHPEVHCNWQSHFFTRRPFLETLVASPEVRQWLSQPSNRWNRGVDFSPVAIRAMSDFMLERDARREGKSVVGDKSPNSLINGESVRRMHQVYPDGRLIYIVRDGRDTAISHRFQAFIDFPHYLSPEDIAIRDAFAADPDPFYQGKRSLFSSKGLRKAAEKWVTNVQETHALGQEFYGQKYYHLRYEDLLAQPYIEMKRVWQFLDVDISSSALKKGVHTQMNRNPDAAWQEETASDLVANLEKGKSGSWRELFTDKDKEIYNNIADETLCAWNYH